jgi:hypothetical protein
MEYFADNNQTPQPEIVEYEDEDVKVTIDPNDPSLSSANFVISNSSEFVPPPPVETVSEPPRQVQFAEPEPFIPRNPPKKRNPRVEAFFQDVREEVVDKEQAKKYKAQLDAEIKEKLTLVTKINMYLDKDNFPGLREKANLKKKNYTEDDDIQTLRNALELLKRARAAQGAKGVAVTYFDYLCQFTERLSGTKFLFGKDVRGLSANSHKLVGDFDEEINELIIKYSWLFYQPPELRFVGKFIKMISVLDYINKNGMNNVSNVDYSQVDPNMNDQYQDL